MTEILVQTSPRGQQSRASGYDKQKSKKMVKNVKNVKNVPPPLQGRAICIDTISIQYRYNIDTIQYYTQKHPKIPKNT